MASRRAPIHRLHEEILKEEILGKLPLSSQWEARCVCKQWHAMLSTCPRKRAPEDYIVVNATDHLLFYNVSLGRWMKPWPLDWIPLPKAEQLKAPSLCAVFNELLFFRDRSRPPRVAAWNTITNESRVLHEVDPVPGIEQDPSSDDGGESDTLLFGAYVNEKRNGELTLLVYNYYGYPEGDLHCWSGADRRWRMIPGFDHLHGPNFNNRHALVTFVDAGCDLHVYNAEKEELRRLEVAGTNDPFGETPATTYDWDMTVQGARFLLHGAGAGLFVIGTLKLALGDSSILGVLRYDEGSGRMELVSESPEDLVDFGALFSSDGLENIWILFRDMSTMLQFNVVSRSWVVHPSILDRFSVSGRVEPTCGVLYTSLSLPRGDPKNSTVFF